MNDRSPYVALGLEPGVPSQEIKRAYRNLSMRFHPDSSRDPRTAGRFARINRAYKFISARPLPERPVAALRPLPASDPEDLFELGRILGEGRAAEDRARAARYLGLSGKRSAWVFLRKGLYDPDPSVAGACVRAAAALGLSQGAAELASAYLRQGPALREAVLEAARATGDAIFLPALDAAAADEDPARRLAARALRLRIAAADAEPRPA